MALKIGARENTLTGRTKRYRFHAKCTGTIDYDDLVDIMADSHTTVTKSDILAAMNLFADVMSSLVARGNFVKTPFGSFYLSATGASDDATAAFTPGLKGSGHGFRLRFRPDRAFETKLSGRVEVKRDEESWKLFPHPTEMVSATGPREEGLGPGAFARLAGSHLSFDRDDESQGVFFQKSLGDEGVRADVYTEVKPRHLTFQIPADIEPGDYTIAVRSVTKAGTQRSGYLDGKVSLAGALAPT